MPYKEFCVFFSGKLFYKSNRKLFSCVCIAWYKHSRRWENSRQLCKPSTSSRVCITVSNSPNPSCVYIRLCKHGKRFLLLKYFLKYTQIMLVSIMSRIHHILLSSQKLYCFSLNDTKIEKPPCHYGRLNQYTYRIYELALRAGLWIMLRFS